MGRGREGGVNSSHPTSMIMYLLTWQEAGDGEGPSPSKKPKVDDKPKGTVPPDKNFVEVCLPLVPSGWFEVDKEHNHNVYVSGLPHDVTKEEFVEMMSKCGIIMENEDGTLRRRQHVIWSAIPPLPSIVGEPKVKLYRDSEGELKGDGLCCYLKVSNA